MSAAIRERLVTNPYADKWAVLAIVGIGIFMATLDSSIVNISLPAIATSFGEPLNGAVEWVIIAYLVVVAALLLTIGRLADITGRKPIWLAGLVVFTLGSALSGAAPTLGWLVGFRALQGAGGALLMAISPAMLTTAFPPHERGRALGLNSLTVALGISTGPTLGGILTQDFTWRAIFYVNVPIGIVGVFATLRILREQVKRGEGRFDPLGAALLGVGLAALTLGLSFGQEWGWSSSRLITCMVVAVICLTALVFVESRVNDPIVDLSLLRNRLFAAANGSLVLAFLALTAVSFLMPFYLEELRGFSTLDAGLLLTPLPLTIACIAPFSGALADRIGTRWLASIGLAIACLGLVLISTLTAQTPVVQIIGTLVFTGIGQGLFQSPNNSALMGAAPRGRQGIAAGFLATGRVVGQSVSVALAGAIFMSLGGADAGAQLAALGQTQAGRVSTLQQTFDTAFQGAFLVCAAIAAIGVFTSLVRGKEMLEKKPARG
ncbi:MAG TPA: DHA2 family efflux MFS transporter permease subunit [Chloroflexota bacterium]|nr:DHA2 family efflux MFS transporter permease subunit [Chloroflexota bacterium]